MRNNAHTTNITIVSGELHRDAFGRRAGHRHPRRGGDGHGHGRGGGRRPGRGRGGRAGRGDLRGVVLTLLNEEPMHGYQLITVIAERTENNWAPSPGAIYPTLSMLEDEGLITISTDSGRKMAALTEAGVKTVEENKREWGTILAAYRNPDEHDASVHRRRTEFHKLRELVKATDEDKTEQVIEILRRAGDEIKRL